MQARIEHLCHMEMKTAALLTTEVTRMRRLIIQSVDYSGEFVKAMVDSAG